MDILIVRREDDDWESMYIDGVLMLEDNVIAAEEALAAAGLSVRIAYIDQSSIDQADELKEGLKGRIFEY